MDPILEGLRAFASPPPWLTAASDGARVAKALRRAVPDLTDGLEQLVACSVEDLRLKGREWIGRYVVTLEDRSGAMRQIPVAGALTVDGVPAGGPNTDLPLGGSGWRVHLGDPPLTMSSSGDDRKLAALPLITDPVFARPCGSRLT